MTGEDRTVAIIGAVTTVLSVIGLIQAIFVKQNPEDVPPTSAEVVEAFQGACEATLAKDDAWLAAHPRS